MSCIRTVSEENTAAVPDREKRYPDFREINEYESRFSRSEFVEKQPGKNSWRKAGEDGKHMKTKFNRERVRFDIKQPDTLVIQGWFEEEQPEQAVFEAFLDGKETEQISGKELSRKLSVVLTERVRPEMMTCKEVVATGRYPYTGKFGVLSKEDWKLVDEAMELVHIHELADRDFSKTSDGQKQRVMLARAICQQPDIIILDEPTSFLDIRYKLEFLSIIQNMSRERNLSVIMSLHELDLAGRISDKIACVRGDKVDRFGTPEEIFTQGYIPQLYQMTTGSYDERTGDLELPKTEGEPKVFVIAGNGTGTAVFRKLQRERVPFVTGILWENDLDYPAAKALATEVISVKPFGRIEEKEIQKAKEWIKKCDKVICTLDVEKSGEFAKPLSGLFEMCK